MYFSDFKVSIINPAKFSLNVYKYGRRKEQSNKLFPI